MGHTIEAARSGRAKCRKCKKAIVKGELRFGEEVQNPFAASDRMTYRWYHLTCAALASPEGLQGALSGFEGEIPDRQQLESRIAEGRRRQKPKSFPYGERAPSGRSRCVRCGGTIGKGEFRIAVEREIETGSFVSAGAGYLHPGCALPHTEDEDLARAVEANSTSLDTEELVALTRLMSVQG